MEVGKDIGPDAPKRRKKCRSFFILFRNVFMHEKEIDENIVYVLRTRAWIAFSAQVLLRIGEIFTE